MRQGAKTRPGRRWGVVRRCHWRTGACYPAPAKWSIGALGYTAPIFWRRLHAGGRDRRGAGFPGSHLCRLLAEGWDVLAVDTSLSALRVTSAIWPGIKTSSFRRRTCCASRAEGRGKVGYVLHFASPASPPDYLKHPIETNDGGLSGHAERLGTGAKQERKVFSSFHERMLRRSGKPLHSPKNIGDTSIPLGRVASTTRLNAFPKP